MSGSRDGPPSTPGGTGAPERGSRPFPGARPSPADPFDAGPYVRLQSALHLPPPAEPRMAWRRALVVAAVAWLPLLLLSAMGGFALRPGARGAFLLDFWAHGRYLIALPFLVAAEGWCLPRLAAIAGQFRRAGLVVGEDRVRLDALVRTCRLMLDHPGLELALVAMAYATTIVTTATAYPSDVSSWVVPEGASGSRALSVAGWWRLLVSHPLFLLMVLAWLWRVAVWGRFLWGVSRMSLRLVAAHPDQAAGLRFLAVSLGAYSPIAFALGATAAGTMARSLVFEESTVQMGDHVGAIGAAVGVVLVVFVGPLLPFTPSLLRTRLRGIVEYGVLASGLGRRFEERWLRTGSPLGSEALDANDFSATTDLYSIAANARQMRLVPIGLRDLVPLVAATLIPFLPLVLLVISFQELVAKLVNLLL